MVISGYDVSSFAYYKREFEIRKIISKENMKKLLKEKNLMWMAIAALTVSNVCLHMQTKKARHTQRGVVERMRHGMGEMRRGGDARESRMGEAKEKMEAIKEKMDGQKREGRPNKKK